MHQRVLCYLGVYMTVSVAYKHWRNQVAAGEDAQARKHARAMVKKLALYL